MISAAVSVAEEVVHVELSLSAKKLGSVPCTWRLAAGSFALFVNQKRIIISSLVLSFTDYMHTAVFSELKESKDKNNRGYVSSTQKAANLFNTSLIYTSLHFFWPTLPQQK